MTLDRRNLQFVDRFVAAATTKPFFNDLMRMHKQAQIFRQLPRLERLDEDLDEAVHAA